MTNPQKGHNSSDPQHDESCEGMLSAKLKELIKRLDINKFSTKVNALS